MPSKIGTKITISAQKIIGCLPRQVLRRLLRVAARERSNLELRLLLFDSKEYEFGRYDSCPRGGTDEGIFVFFCDCDDMLRVAFSCEVNARLPSLRATIHSTVASGVEFFYKTACFCLEKIKNIEY